MCRVLQQALSTYIYGTKLCSGLHRMTVEQVRMTVEQVRMRNIYRDDEIVQTALDSVVYNFNAVK
jgi:hypothetical protein